MAACVSGKKNYWPALLRVMLVFLIGFMTMVSVGCSDDDPAPPPPAKKSAEQLSTKKTNWAPVLKPIGDKMVIGGEQLRFVVGAIDTLDDVLTYRAVRVTTDTDGNEVEESLSEALPGATLEVDLEEETPPGVALFSWQPTDDQAGTYTIRFTVEDDGVEVMRDEEVITLRVYASTDPVIGEPIHATVTRNWSGPAHVNLNVKVENAARQLIPGDLTFALTEGGEPRVSSSEGDVSVFSNMYDHYTLLMLDFSGSVTDNPATVDSLIAAAKGMVESLVAKGETIAIYYFQDNVHRHVDFTDDRDTLIVGLDSLVGEKVDGSRTNLYGGFLTGLGRLDGAAVGSGKDGVRAGSMIVFTDGAHGVGATTTIDFVRTEVDASAHDVYVVGLDQVPPENDDELDRDTLLGLVGAGRYVEAVGYDDENDARPMLDEAFDMVATDISAKLDQETGKYYMVTFCSAKKDAVSREVAVRVTDPLGRTQSGSYTYPSAASFVNGCVSDVDDMKLAQYDFDNDKYYEIYGPLQDCNDFDRAVWVSCDTCEDADGDGYRGTGDCDATGILNLFDCRDDPEDPYAPYINPNRTDELGDDIDADCTIYDG